MRCRVAKFHVFPRNFRLFPGLLRGYCANLRACRDYADYLRACATHKSMKTHLLVSMLVRCRSFCRAHQPNCVQCCVLSAASASVCAFLSNTTYLARALQHCCKQPLLKLRTNPHLKACLPSWLLVVGATKVRLYALL